MRDVTVILFQETYQTNVPKLRVQQLNQPESHVHVVNVGREESEQWTGNRRFIFLLPRLMLRTHFALRARYRVRLAWLINHLFCRLETDNKFSNALGVKFEATNIEMNFLKLLRFS